MPAPRRWLSMLVAMVVTGMTESEPLDFGNYTFNVTTSSQSAQSYFAEGLMHEFGFNQAESQAAFAKAQAEDATCAMCEWGLAYAFGPFLNKPTLTDDEFTLAAAASQRALDKAQATNVTTKESLLIQAMTLRYPSDQNQSAGWLAYANFLAESLAVWSDADMLTFYAEALMDLTPAAYFEHETMLGPGTLKPTAAEAMRHLEEALKLNPDHPLALHLYIHITEPGTPGFSGPGIHAGRGDAAATTLAALNLTGSGHLEHMPGHLFLRVGKYAQAVEANKYAHLADDLYVSKSMSPYGPGHNTYFLIYAACLDGQSKTAEDYGIVLRDIYLRDPQNKDAPSCSTGWNLPLTTLLRFGGADLWNQILQDDTLAPGGENSTANAFSALLRHYSRGMAQASLNASHDLVSEELDQMRRLMPSVPDSSDLALVANFTLTARLLVAQSDLAGALELLQKARALQDAWKYNEPPPWHFSLRQCIGTVQLAAGDATGAEKSFLGDLKIYVNNGWSLFGLKLAMLRQPQKYGPDAVAAVEAALETAWERADVPLTSPCPMFVERLA